MSTIEFLRYIRKYLIHCLIVFIIGGVLSGFILIPHVLIYKGETTFYMASESFVDPNTIGLRSPGQPDPLGVSVAQQRNYQLSFSTEMKEMLIKQFNLYQHYKIDTTEKYHYERVIAKLGETITFKNFSNDVSGIMVYDRNNEVAAAMANAIVWKLDELNKKYLNDKLQSNLVFYESYLSESSKISQKQARNLDRYLNKLSEMKGKYDTDGSRISDLEFSVFKAINSIENATDQLMKAKNLYQSALSMRQNQNSPSIVIIKKATPQLKSKKILLVFYSSLAGLVTLILFLFGLYTTATYKAELKALFRGQ